MSWTDLSHETVSAADVHDSGGHSTFDFDADAHWQDDKYVEPPGGQVLIDTPPPWAHDLQVIQEALDLGLLERTEEGELVRVFSGDELNLGEEGLAKLYGSTAA
jgi:hypothetical protein